jgi:hypothetical protein
MEDTLEVLRFPIGKYVHPESYTPADLQEWVATIDALPKWMDHCIENLDAVQLATPYRPGGWTISQVVHHLADSHINAYVRLKLALTEDAPTVKPYEEAAWAELYDAKELPVNISVTLLHALHRRWVAALKNMKPEDWDRTYFHPEQKKNIALWKMTANYAWHSRHHTEHIKRLRDQMGW